MMISDSRLDDIIDENLEGAKRLLSEASRILLEEPLMESVEDKEFRLASSLILAELFPLVRSQKNLTKIVDTVNMHVALVLAKLRQG